MTWIVQGARTKKELRKLLEVNPRAVWLEDPSVFAPDSFAGPAANLPVGARVVVTNHPRRTWFAEIERRADGSFIVR